MTTSTTDPAITDTTLETLPAPALSCILAHLEDVRDVCNLSVTSTSLNAVASAASRKIICTACARQVGCASAVDPSKASISCYMHRALAMTKLITGDEHARVDQALTKVDMCPVVGVQLPGKKYRADNTFQIMFVGSTFYKIHCACGSFLGMQVKSLDRSNNEEYKVCCRVSTVYIILTNNRRTPSTATCCWALPSTWSTSTARRTPSPTPASSANA